MTTQENPSTAEVTRLFEVAGREGGAIRRPDGGVTELHEVCATKTALQGLKAAVLRAALRDRYPALGGGQVS